MIPSQNPNHAKPKEAPKSPDWIWTVPSQGGWLASASVLFLCLCYLNVFTVSDQTTKGNELKTFHH